MRASRGVGRTRRVGRARVGLVVEGQCERDAFRHLSRLVDPCPPFDRPAVVGGIGETASPRQIAERVAPAVAFLQYDNSRVIVCIDRESREASADALAAEVEVALRSELPRCGGTLRTPVVVVVADRAFEAWLLADIQNLASLHRKAPPPARCYEGYMRVRGAGRGFGYHYGDDLLERTFGRYRKTREGPSLFSELSVRDAREVCGNRAFGSASLDRFLRILEA